MLKIIGAAPSAVLTTPLRACAVVDTFQSLMPTIPVKLFLWGFATSTLTRAPFVTVTETFTDAPSLP